LVVVVVVFVFFFFLLLRVAVWNFRKLEKPQQQIEGRGIGQKTLLGSQQAVCTDEGESVEAGARVEQKL
jgi:hypothetical protein